MAGPLPLDTAVGETSSIIGVLRAIRERWWVIVLCVLLCAGGAVALALSQTKEYEATAKLLVGSSTINISALVDQGASAASDPQRDQATVLLLVGSQPVAERVKTALHLPDDPASLVGQISASSEPDANLINVTATDPDPRRAEALADAFAGEYVAYRKAADLLTLQQGQKVLEDRLAQLSPKAIGQRERIGTAIAQVVALQGTVSGGALVVGRAGRPGTPSSPRPKRDAILGVIMGLVLGLSLVFLVELFDRRVKSVEEIEGLYGIRALTSIPERTKDPVTQRDRAAALEPFRILRNSLDFLAISREIRIVLVTSAVPGEGKSTVASGLARAMALSGLQAVLVEVDLRRPTFHQQFDLGGDTRGLTTALVGRVPAVELLRPALPGLPTLKVLPSGPVPPNSAELLRSREMREVLDSLRDEAHIVVLDAPPLLPVADTQVLLDNDMIDACLVVARTYRTTRDEITRSRAVLERHRQTNLGLVVNGLRELDSGYDYYGADDEPAAQSLGSRKR